jgi:hypothetical protein
LREGSSVRLIVCAALTVNSCCFCQMFYFFFFLFSNFIHSLLFLLPKSLLYFILTICVSIFSTFAIRCYIPSNSLRTSKSFFLFLFPFLSPAASGGWLSNSWTSFSNIFSMMGHEESSEYEQSFAGLSESQVVIFFIEPVLTVLIFFAEHSFLLY